MAALQPLATTASWGVAPPGRRRRGRRRHLARPSPSLGDCLQRLYGRLSLRGRRPMDDQNDAERLRPSAKREPVLAA